MHGAHQAGGKQSLRQHRAESLGAMGCRLVIFVLLARQRTVEFISHAAWLVRAGDCYRNWLAHDPQTLVARL